MVKYYNVMLSEQEPDKTRFNFCLAVLKRGDAVSKYNYFDDDDENLRREKENIFSKISLKNFDFEKFNRNARNKAEEIIHGGTLSELSELKELPNLQRLALKLLAFILFIVAIIIFILCFSHTIQSQKEKNDLFYADAGKVCTDYITNYGTIKAEPLDEELYGEDKARLTGLCYARQMDFDNDGSDELMICYHNKNIYYLEIWGYSGKDFIKLYSEEANHTEDANDGYWVGFYHKSNKYYICKSAVDTPDAVELLALKGDKFKKSSQCDYDYKNNIYSVKGKINAQDFETIKLSVIKSSRAEVLIDTVTANIDSFSTVSVAALESAKSNEQLKAEAYYEIVERRNTQYGKAEVITKEGKSYIDGVAYVSLVDFDNDGNEELFIVYRKQIKHSATNAYNGNFIIIEEPTYCMEVYNWNGAVAKKIFSKDSISSFLDDEDINYVMLKKSDNKTEICTNTYSFATSYTYSATSKIYSLEDETFETVYNARMEYDYGYRQYYLDGEYTYKSEFEDKGYEVPLFLDDEGSYDNSIYSVTFLSGDKGADFDNVVNNTVDTIQKLNKNYDPKG